MDNIPVKLDKKMTAQLDRLVASGLYLSRSEALRDGARRLVLANYLSVSQYLMRIAKTAAELLSAAFEDDIREIRVFGSTARGDAGRDSDIDLLVIARDGATHMIEEQVHEVLEPLSVGAEVLFTPIVVGRREYNRQTRAGYLFMREINSSGIELYKAPQRGGRASA